MKTKEEFLEGQILLIDKPLEWSSFQAVNAIRWAISRKFNLKKIKVGHAGTLDPLATGLLLVCTGKFTKKISELQGLSKEYTGTITLGAITPSYDLETEITERLPTEHITAKLIRETAQAFVGKIFQKPPVFSAVKKEGKRLYEYARKGKEVVIAPREVEILAFDITKIDMPEVHFSVACSKGTYIRSLAHDFGQALQSGGYLSALRRTKIGDYHVNNGISPVEFRENLQIEGQKT